MLNVSIVNAQRSMNKPQPSRRCLLRSFRTPFRFSLTPGWKRGFQGFSDRFGAGARSRMLIGKIQIHEVGHRSELISVRFKRTHEGEIHFSQKVQKRGIDIRGMVSNSDCAFEVVTLSRKRALLIGVYPFDSRASLPTSEPRSHTAESPSGYRTRRRGNRRAAGCEGRGA